MFKCFWNQFGPLFTYGILNLYNMNGTGASMVKWTKRVLRYTKTSGGSLSVFWYRHLR